MPVPSAISDLSTTPSLNSPAGSESPALVDDYLRTHAAFIKQVNDESVKTTGDQTIAGAKTFSSAPVVPGLNGGQLAGMRNKIINGKMDIAQRGTSFVSPATGSYMLDRWQHQSVNDGVFTVTQASDSPANEFENSLRLTVTTADASIAAGQFCTLRQPIEGYNARDLIGRTFTLSFRVRSSKTGTHCVAFINDAGDRSYIAEYTINAANTWETKSITLSGGLITAGTWNWTNGRGVILSFALASGSTFQTTAGAWQTGNFLATANQVNCLDTIDNIFAITGVQLEVGSVATPFEHRPYGAELALCQRYCWVGVINLTCSANSTSEFASMGFQPFPSPLRAAPTLSAGSFSSLSFSGVGNGAGLFDGGLTFSSGEATVNGITGLITNNVNSRPQGTTGVFSANANIPAEL